MRGTGTSRAVSRAHAQALTAHPPIINQPSSIINPRAFTLIELLVVIAIVAMLMAILMPCLQRARKQARAAACQSKLSQWGIRLATFANENEGRLWLQSPSDRSTANTLGWANYDQSILDANSIDSDRWKELAALRFCPLAVKTAREVGYDSDLGGTFLAWEGSLYGKTIPSSYYMSIAVLPFTYPPDFEFLQRTWTSVYVKGSAYIPAFLDSSRYDLQHCATDPPPEHDAIPFCDTSNRWGAFCINRHDGSVNSLFLDSSVRKVGLKELWTLKWQPDYETRGPWTKAGGGRLEDWPQWMRGFKDY